MAVSTGFVAGGALVVALGVAFVHRDATRVGVDVGSPVAWAGLVALTSGVGVTTAVLVPDAPLPGVLVLVALGPLLYLLERDDSLHGDDDPDPTQLPSAAAAAAERDTGGERGTDGGSDVIAEDSNSSAEDPTPSVEDSSSSDGPDA